MSEFITLPIGSRVGRRYRIRQVLGQGETGRTYLAADSDNADAPIVLKEFVPAIHGWEAAALTQVRDLFVREAVSLKELRHPQIPKVRGYFEEKGRIFLARDYIVGKNYREILQEHGPFSELESLDFLRNILGILDYIHRQKQTIHRDIAPENILREEGTGRLFLIDFGIAKYLVQKREVSAVPAGNHALPISGKLGYCPPEQMVTGVCSESSDLYALATITIELITGKRSRDPSTWQQDLPCPISHVLAAVLTKMLAYKVDNRYPSAQAVLAALATVPINLGDIPTTIEPALQETDAELTGPHSWLPGSGLGNNATPNSAAIGSSSPSLRVNPAAESPTSGTGGFSLPWTLFFPVFLALGLIGFWAIQQLQATDPTTPTLDPLSRPAPTASPATTSPVPLP